MSGHYVLQARTSHFAQQDTRGPIIEMTEIARNTPLKCRGIATTRQHLEIVIAFQHKSLAILQHIDDMGRYPTDIR